jgi:hypothetical protein
VAISTFDYSDLNAYLLVVVGLAKPEDDLVQLYDNIATRAQGGVGIPLKDIQLVCRHESLITLPWDETLDRAIEILGGGIHRILVTDKAGDVVGILNQLRLIEFFWNEGVHFPTIERLYPMLLKDLNVGTHHTIAIK